jgi:cytochrome P450
MVAEVTAAPEVEFDHHTPEYADHWPELTAELRAKCPVTHTSAWGGFYVATTYEHVGEVVRDDERFSSEHEVEGFEAPYTLGITIPASPNGSIPIDLDPPRNKPYRKLLDPLFSPKASARWEPFLRDAVTACIDSFIESGEGDIVYDLANPIPALLTCKLMGLPVEDWHIYADPMHEIVYTPPGTPEYEEIQQQVNLMLGKIFEAVQARRTEPQDDLITILVQAEIEGAPIPDDVIMQILFLVLVGGVDTTTSVMANALRWLSQHPDERDRLRQDPTLLPTAREEMLRYFTPTQGLARTCTRDTELAGVPLSLGDRVFMSFAAANRDPAVFPDPDAMVLDRAPNPHATFGMGVHRCLGSNIARVEFDVVVSEVLRRLPDFVVDEAGSKRYDTVGVVNGWQRMPMTFTPGQREGASFEFKR